MHQEGTALCIGNFLSQLDGATQDETESEHIVKSLMVEFFKGVSEDRHRFLVESCGSSENDEDHGNPLEGSYPYGRTGRTQRDPLQGFFHFKYSKRGKPVARLIKPGKYTAYCTTKRGDVSTPYEEHGSEIEVGPNGKCRHIASYTLDELIALGWDGAKYVSTQSRTAVTGQYVPFVVGYDSDKDDRYEEINVQAGKRAGTIGLTPEEVGLYMTIPDMQGTGQPQLVQLRNGR